MKQPEGFVNPNHPYYVCKLLKSLYGIKQASRIWHLLVKKILLKFGFIQYHADYCIFIYVKDDKIIIISLYVDDILMFSCHIILIDEIKALLSKNFKIKDLGPVKSCLGLLVNNNISTGIVSIGQNGYLTATLDALGMSSSKISTIPIAGGEILLPDINYDKINPTKYRNIVGKWMYAMVSTRPDLAYAVGYASRFLHAPNSQHLIMVDRIARYIQGTKNFALQYKSDSNNFKLIGYCDADWAGDKFDRKSTSGYIFFLSGGPISWNSKKQATVALSSTEAEYISITQATKEAIWLRLLLKNLGFEQKDPTIIYVDNQSAISLSKNPVYHSRTKHIDIQHHFIREKIESKEIQLLYCSSKEQLADICTKPLSKDIFINIRNQLGINHFTD
jgi:hypothetical protein